MNVVDMSDRVVNEQFMAGLLDEDAEGWARLSGLLTMMALPPVRDRCGLVQRRRIEISIKVPDTEIGTMIKWVAIEGISVEMHRVICWTGSNGSRRQYVFVRGEEMPHWRVPSMSREHDLSEARLT